MYAKIIRIFLPLFFFTFNSLVGQIFKLELFEPQEILIGPENVNIYLEEQKDYYLNKYRTLSNDLNERRKKLKKEYEKIEMKQEKNERHIRKLTEIITKLSKIEIEESILYEYMALWQKFEMPIANYATLNPSNCYEIHEEGRTYSERTYRIISPIIADSIVWTESLHETEEVTEEVLFREARVEFKTTKKKGCISDNPEDCVIYEEIKIPAEYTTVSTNVVVGCYLDFGDISNCYRHIKVMRDVGLPKERYKVLSIRSGKELLFDKITKVDCN